MLTPICMVAAALTILEEKVCACARVRACVWVCGFGASVRVCERVRACVCVPFPANAPVCAVVFQ